MVEEYKIKEVIPFSGVFYRSCYYGPLFTGIRHLCGSIYPFISNDLFYYQYHDDGYGINLKVVEENVLSEERLFESMKLNLEYYSEGCLISWIKNELLKDHMVCVPINRYYWNDAVQNKNQYLKNEYLHFHLIIGFDDTTQKFSVIGSLSEECYRAEIDYHTVEQCYLKRVQKKYEMFSMNSSIGIQEKKEISDINTFRKLYIKNHFSLREQIKGGMAAIRMATEYYSNTSNSGCIVERERQRFAYTIFLLETAKKTQTFQLCTLFGKKECLHLQQLCDRIVVEYTMLQGIFMRSLVAKIYNDDSAQRIAFRLNKIYELEDLYFNEVDAILINARSDSDEY